MSFVSDVYPVMPTRPCRFCLRLQGGSVFADFDTDDANVVILSRISFDGFGCCHVKEAVKSMNSNDSRILLEAVARNQPSSIQVEEILRKYFKENADVIWNDALTVHDLI